MIVKDIWFELKDGRRALLRSPKEEDIEGMLECLRLTAGETHFIIRYPEECGKYTYESEKALFEKINAAPNNAMIMCLVDGRVVGNCDISHSASLKTRHRASIGIGLLKEFWGQGIGTRMFQEMIRIAEEEFQGITQIELEFVEGNSRARALYEKMGFRIAGVHPNAIRLKDGTLLNNYLMIREVSRNRGV